jgi:hypothetical protein
MRRILHGALALASLALFLGYGAIFLVRWRTAGLILAALFAALMAGAAAAATGAIAGRGPRLAATLAYLALGGWAGLTIIDAFKNDLIRDLLYLQVATAIIGLLVCALPRRDD